MRVILSTNQLSRNPGAVHYRKQRETEQGRFAASFADACAQLGGEAPAVRLGGGYALAALADRQSDMQ